MPFVDLSNVGADWLAAEINSLPDQILRPKPSEINEQYRYLPASVTPSPGYIRYAWAPYLREIVDCFDIYNDVREVNVRKGVQVGFTTVLESGLLYLIVFVKYLPCMLVTADTELAHLRIENNVIPMIDQSGLTDLIHSSDVGNKRKTGKTKNYIQWQGGGYLLPLGILNPAKLRMNSIPWLLKDELDAWPEYIGKDGDPDKVTDSRAEEFWNTRKIFRGSTPLIKGSSKIDDGFERGDGRYYNIICESCGYQQPLRWAGKNSDTRKTYGFKWETESGILVPDSVRYECKNCTHCYHDHDKQRMLSEDQGAKWVPTKKPVEDGIRSYQLQGYYSIHRPWSKSVIDFLDAYDPETNKTKSVGKLQTFYNNVLGQSFEVRGSKIKFEQVSWHRRTEYSYGQVPSGLATKYTGYPISMLTMTVDVHKRFLAVAVHGWTRGQRSFLVDYWWLTDDSEEGCERPESPVWAELQEKIETLEYRSDDGRQYWISTTGIDARYCNDLVVSFCAKFDSGVVPILGTDRPAKSNKIKEFALMETKLGTPGYNITVDHYKDRLAPALRREWYPGDQLQPRYHFNAPIDVTTPQLTELTKETRVRKTDAKGRTVFEWVRPSGARNELWDLTVYAHALVEIQAWEICVNQFDLKTVDWDNFWDYVEEAQLFFTCAA